MSLFAYTGTLADIRLGMLTDLAPLCWVRPEVESFGPDGLVSAVRVPLTMNPTSGAFTVNLIPSGELTPATGGPAGVDYIIEVALFKPTVDGDTFLAGTDVWKFTAVAGGGNVGTMQGGSTLAVWIGPPFGAWPSAPLPKGLYLDPITGDGFLET